MRKNVASLIEGMTTNKSRGIAQEQAGFLRRILLMDEEAFVHPSPSAFQAPKKFLSSAKYPGFLVRRSVLVPCWRFGPEVLACRVGQPIWASQERLVRLRNRLIERRISVSRAE